MGLPWHPPKNHAYTQAHLLKFRTCDEFSLRFRAEYKEIHYLCARQGHIQGYEYSSPLSYALSDYANRDWDGLVDTFYKVRWRMFFDAVLAAFDAGEPFVNLKGPRVPQGLTEEECKRALQLDTEIWVSNVNGRISIDEIMGSLIRYWKCSWQAKQPKHERSFAKLE